MGKTNQDKFFRQVKILLTEALPEGCSVGLKYRASRVTAQEAAADDSEGWVPTTMSDTRSAINAAGETKGIFNLEGQGEKIDIQITLTPSGNSTPEVDSAHIGFSFDSTI